MTMDWPNYSTLVCVLWASLCALFIRPLWWCMGAVVVGSVAITVLMS
jgi:hypothetical protein